MACVTRFATLQRATHGIGNPAFFSCGAMILILSRQTTSRVFYSHKHEHYLLACATHKSFTAVRSTPVPYRVSLRGWLHRSAVGNEQQPIVSLGHSLARGGSGTDWCTVPGASTTEARKLRPATAHTDYQLFEIQSRVNK